MKPTINIIAPLAIVYGILAQTSDPAYCSRLLDGEPIRTFDDLSPIKRMIKSNNKEEILEVLVPISYDHWEDKIKHYVYRDEVYYTTNHMTRSEWNALRIKTASEGLENMISVNSTNV